MIIASCKLHFNSSIQVWAWSEEIFMFSKLSDYTGIYHRQTRGVRYWTWSCALKINAHCLSSISVLSFICYQSLGIIHIGHRKWVTLIIFFPQFTYPFTQLIRPEYWQTAWLPVDLIIDVYALIFILWVLFSKHITEQSTLSSPISPGISWLTPFSFHVGMRLFPASL